MSIVSTQIGHPQDGPRQMNNGDATPAGIRESALRSFIRESLRATVIGLAYMDPVSAAWLASTQAQTRR